MSGKDMEYFKMWNEIKTVIKDVYDEILGLVDNW